MRWDNRVGIVPISINGLSRLSKMLNAARQDFLLVCLSAGSPRCHRYTYRHCRRSVNISRFICSSPIPAATTGAILKIRRIWQNCWHVSGDTVLKTVIYRCFVTMRMPKVCLTAMANRMSVTRCWPRGGNWGATIFICSLNWKTARSWMRLSTLRRITCCITSRPISLSWKTAQWRA